MRHHIFSRLRQQDAADLSLASEQWEQASYDMPFKLFLTVSRYFITDHITDHREQIRDYAQRLLKATEGV